MYIIHINKQKWFCKKKGNDLSVVRVVYKFFDVVLFYFFSVYVIVCGDSCVCVKV